VKFERSHSLADVRAQWDDTVEGGRVDRRSGALSPAHRRQARQGKLYFFDLRDGTGTIQLFRQQEFDRADAFERVESEVDRGDWVRRRRHGDEDRSSASCRST